MVLSNGGGWNVASGRNRNRRSDGGKAQQAQSSWGKGGNGAGQGGKDQGGGKAQGGKGQGGTSAWQGGKGQGGGGQGGGNGKGGTGGGKGMGAGMQGDKAGGAAETNCYADWKMPRGTKIECPNAECTRIFEWADVAGWACPKCGMAYRWGHLWEEVLKPKFGDSNLDDSEEGAAGLEAEDAEAAVEPKSIPKTDTAQAPDVDATITSKQAAKAARDAMEKAEAKLERERIVFVDMGRKLEKLLGLVDDQAAKMATKRLVCIASYSDHAAAKSISDLRDAEHQKAGISQLDGVAGLLDATTDRTAMARRTAKAQVEGKAAEMEKLQAETDRTEKAADKAEKEHAARVQAAKTAAGKAAADIAKLEQEAAERGNAAKRAREAQQSASAQCSGNGVQVVASTPEPAQEVAEPKAEETPKAEEARATGSEDTTEDTGGMSFAQYAAADDDVMEESEEEEEQGPRDMDPATWTKEVGEWAFFAEAEDVPNPDLLAWFVSWEDDPGTIQQLSELLTTARDKFLDARKGAAADGALANNVAQAGNVQQANEMQTASQIYCVKANCEIRDQLVAHLKAGMQHLFDQRQKDLDAGKRKAPKEWKFKAVHATRTAAKAKTGAKGGVKRSDKHDKTDKKRNTAAMAEAAKVAKEKGIAGLGENGLTLVPAGTATAAATGC